MPHNFTLIRCEVSDINNMQKKGFSRGQMAILIIALVLIIDQIIKVWVKLNFSLYDRIIVFDDWFQIYFVENNGMAFGMEFISKIFLSLLRIVAVFWLVRWLIIYIRRGMKWGFVACLSFIVAGAAGNIVDSLCYGWLFSESTRDTVATFLPVGGGYAAPLFGKVVDMFYFPLISWNWPSWLPVIGGNHFIFFSPIFNFADASISCGIIALLLFYSKYLQKLLDTSSKSENKAANKKSETKV